MIKKSLEPNEREKSTWAGSLFHGPATCLAKEW